MAQTIDNETYHNRVEALLNGVRQLNESVNSFLTTTDAYQASSETTEKADLKEDASTKLDDVKQQSKNASDIIAGINIDDLLKNAKNPGELTI